MKESERLFGDGYGDAIEKRVKVERWCMVTNHLNFFYMLGAGLLMPPKGFGGKYYKDTLKPFSGWIPVFPGQIPMSAIDLSVAEKDYLVPCILEIDADRFESEAVSADHDGKTRNITFPRDVDGTEAFVLLPAPLPVTRITSVFFRSQNDKASCQRSAGDYNNVDLSGVQLRVQKKLFEKTTKSPWPQDTKGVPERDVVLERPFAVGGILAMLARFGNIGDRAIDAGKIAFDQEGGENDGTKSSSIVKATSDWLNSRRPTRKESGLGTTDIYWRLIDCLVVAREHGLDLAPHDAIISELKEIETRVDEKIRPNIEKLIKDLEGVAGLGDYSITDLLMRHENRPLSRALLLFFLRDGCAELLEFRHDLLEEHDYIAAAVLFGAREGWNRLPTAVRSMAGLENACTYKMAAASHKAAETTIDLGPLPARPESLRELLSARPEGKAQQAARVTLAKACGWDCVNTRVSLGKGDYSLSVDGRGVHIVFKGEPRCVVTEAGNDVVLKHLETVLVPTDVENAVRSSLTGGKP